MTVPRFRPPPELDARASARIDLLRSLLILQVVLGHFAFIAYPTMPTLDLDQINDQFVAAYRIFTRFGPQAAYIFVCMSGFFLGPRLLAVGLKQPDAEPLAHFIRGRLARIYPTLVASLIITLICDYVAINAFGSNELYRRIHYYDSVEALNIERALGNLLSLQPTFVGAFGTNAPLWTLGYIVQFYVAAAALAALMRCNHKLAFSALAVLMTAGSFAWESEWSLLFGCWILCGMLRWKRPGSSKNGWLAIACGLCCFVGANLLSVQGSVLLSGCAGALFLIGATARLAPGGPERLPAWLGRLNAASFPLYAFHYPLALLLYVALLPRVDADALGFRLAWPVLAFAASLAVALPFQAALERWQKARPA